MRHSPKRVGRQRTAGYTLTELMTAVVIVAILATLATPSYRSYILRTHRVTAKSALLSIATSQERYYIDHRTYAPTINDLQTAGYPVTSENGMYALTIEAGDTATYTAKATATVGTNGVDMRQDTKCQWFAITAAGVRTASSPDCW